MATVFDSKKIRDRMLHSEFGIAYLLREDVGDLRQRHSLAGNASLCLGNGITCILVGLDAEAAKLFEFARICLEEVIKEPDIQDVRRPGLREALRYRDLAMCQWLLSLPHQEAMLRCIESAEQFFASDDNLFSLLDSVLPVYLEAGAFRQAIRSYRAANKADIQDNVHEESLPAWVAFQIALDRMNEPVASAESITARIDTYLTLSIPDWLTSRLMLFVAQWLKLRYCWLTEPRLSAQQALLRAHAYLPGTEPPMGVTAQ
jgi:tetratricopeptide (TPR) repeat protein